MSVRTATSWLRSEHEAPQIQKSATYLTAEVVVTTVLIKSQRKSSVIVTHVTLVITNYTAQSFLKPYVPTLQKT